MWPNAQICLALKWRMIFTFLKGWGVGREEYVTETACGQQSLKYLLLALSRKSLQIPAWVNVCECMYMFEKSKRQRERRDPRIAEQGRTPALTPASADSVDPLDETQLLLKVLISTFSVECWVLHPSSSHLSLHPDLCFQCVLGMRIKNTSGTTNSTGQTLMLGFLS